MRNRNPAQAKDFPVQVAGWSSFGIEPKINGERTYNMLVSDDWLVCVPGYEKAIEFLPKGEGRGVFKSENGNFFIAVINANVYRLNPGLGSILIGQLETSSGKVFIDENLARQICIVDGQSAYIYNWGIPPTLVKQTGGNWGTTLVPNYVTYHDSFFLFGNGLKTPAGTFWYVYQPTAVPNPTTIDFVSTQTFQTKPDYPLAVKRIPAQSSNVLVFGTSLCEIQTHLGGSDNYRRNSSVSVDYGCLSIDTIAASGEYIAWLGTNESSAPVIMIFSGQKAAPISTDGIDKLLLEITRPDLSTAYFKRIFGHLCYVITFYFQGTTTEEADNITLAYDLTVGKFINLSDHNMNYHPAMDLVYFDQSEYFVSINNGSLYRWDQEITCIIEDIPDPLNQIPVDPRLVFEIPRYRVCNTLRAPKNTPFVVENFTFTIQQGEDPSPPVFDCLVLMIHEDNRRIFSENNIQVVPEWGGVEDCVGQPYRQKVQYAQSKDGAVTWSTWLDKQLNPQGRRRNILKYERLGYANEWTPKLRFCALGSFIATGGVVSIKSTRANAP